MKKFKYLFILCSVFFLFVLGSCQKEICTVTFENENGDFINSVQVYSGDVVDKPETVAEYEGYTFDDWYLGDMVYSFESKVENNITLVAKYNANHYTLTFGQNGPQIEVVYGMPIGQIPTVPSVDGKDYGIWTLEGIILVSTTIFNYTENKVAVANYQDEIFTVSFMDDKEEIKQVVVYGEKAIEPRTPEKVGYDFVGWYHNDERYDFDAPVKSNIKLEPRWVLSDDTTYSVSIFAEINGVYVDVSEKYTNIFEGLKGTTGNVINITELVKETIPSNYTLNVEKSILEGKIAEDGSLKLSVYWNIKRFTVSFDLEDVPNQTVLMGSSANRPQNPKVEGKVFYNWFIGDKEYDFTSEVVSDINLTAYWVKEDEHAVTFDTLNGTKINSKLYKDGEKISIPANLERTGYEFEGWYNGTEEWDFNTPLDSTHGKNINLIAKWTPNKYNLSFNESGNDTIVVTYDKPIGQLPILNDIDSYDYGNWFVDGIEIDAETIWNFDSDKEAISTYFIDMTTQTYDLSTKGEKDLNSQLIDVLGLENVNIDKITADGKEISDSFLSDIEKDVLDENIRKKALIVYIGKVGYKLNTFFATKVIHNYTELKRIQEYGNVKVSEFPGDINYYIYPYSGYFILANDIDASESMSDPYRINTIGQYNSQTWYTEIKGFVGVFDGRGHTISNLHTGKSGLLGDVTKGSVIKNLAITNATIRDNFGGVLCFMFSDATVENVYIEFMPAGSVSNGGIFGRTNIRGTVSNVVIKYKNSRVYDEKEYTFGVLSSWQVENKYITTPTFNNVSFIYENGTDISNMQAIGNSTKEKDIKEYVLQDDGSLLAVKSKTANSNTKITEFISYETAQLNGNEFVNYDENYWDLSGAYPVFK